MPGYQIGLAPLIFLSKSVPGPRQGDFRLFLTKTRFRRRKIDTHLR